MTTQNSAKIATLYESRKPSKTPLRLGIVGCGYVTAMSHLPASQLVNNVEVVALVDLQESLSKPLAQTYGIPICSQDHTQIYDQVDAVIIAVPHHYHASLALDFLQHGIHTLIEKPMAISVAECEAMIAAAQAASCILSVGHMRRFYDSNRLVKHLIDVQFLGPVLSFEAEEAVNFDNFKASPFTVLPPAGGVLFDTGPHVLDMLMWWLGDFEAISYWDDCLAGVEANCRLEATTVNGVTGSVTLSRTRQLKNEIRLVCQEGVIEISTLNPTEIFVECSLFSGPMQLRRYVDETKSRSLIPYFADQMYDFALAILSNHAPNVTPEDGLRLVSLIERCKQQRKLLPNSPWAHLNDQIIQRVDNDRT